jgi:hypothetical protein
MRSIQIPWFHEKYCQEEANQVLRGYVHSTMPGYLVDKNSKYELGEDVYQALASSVGGPRYHELSVCNIW